MSLWKPKPGQWFEIAKKVTMVCCDCRLSHRMQFRVRKNGDLEMRAWRDNRSTAAYRNRKTHRLTIKLEPK